MLNQILDEFENWGKRNVHLSLPGREIEAFQSMKDFISQTYTTARKEAIEEVLKCKPILKSKHKLDNGICDCEYCVAEKSFNKGIDIWESKIKNLNF